MEEPVGKFQIRGENGAYPQDDEPDTFEYEYELVDNADGKFSIVGNELIANNSLDFGAASAYDIEVVAKPYDYLDDLDLEDSDREEFSVNKTFTVKLAYLGAAADDTLEGGDGDNLLIGRNGNDKITSGKGNDTLNGGAGQNSIYCS